MGAGAEVVGGSWKVPNQQKRALVVKGTKAWRKASCCTATLTPPGTALHTPTHIYTPTYGFYSPNSAHNPQLVQSRDSHPQKPEPPPSSAPQTSHDTTLLYLIVATRQRYGIFFRCRWTASSTAQANAERQGHTRDIVWASG